MDSAVATLLSRLETVTARLESVEKQLATGGSTGSSASSSAPAQSGEESPSVLAYEALINQYIQPFVDLSSKVDAPEVTEQANLVLQAVNAQRDMLRVVAASKKPSQDTLNKLIQPTSELMGKISTLRDSKRSSKFFNNLSTVSEGIPALGWVVVAPTPGPHIADMRGGSEFYSNRILKEFKGVNQTQVDWVQSFNSFLKELQAYVKQFHTTGLTWNPKGGDAPSSAPASSSSAPSSGGAPPPPALPPVYVPEPETSSGSADTGKKANLFAELNKGGDITKGLKKVTNDMKNKNRTDISSVVPASASAPKETKAPSKNAAPAKPPKLQLDGLKWNIENQVNNREIVISETEPKQTCYIYKCKNSVIQIKGKINAIVLDSCDKTAVVFENLVSTCDVVNCNSVEVQALGKVPSISIDKTSGCQVHLSKEAIDTEIYTSKSSEMNVSIPNRKEDDDPIEIAVPEQYRTVVKDFKLVTECSSHV